MLLQSSSSWILTQYNGLIEEHMIVISFLTMLVGAGGNAGAQAAVSTVRGIALNKPEFSSARRVSLEAMVLAAMLASVLGVGAWLRESPISPQLAPLAWACPAAAAAALPAAAQGLSARLRIHRLAPLCLRRRADNLSVSTVAQGSPAHASADAAVRPLRRRADHLRRQRG